MFEKVILLTLLTSSLCGNLGRAMEPEEEEDSLPIRTLYLSRNGTRTEPIANIYDLFYETCVSQLVKYVELSQGDPNCGLPEELAQPFLELCRHFAKGLRTKAEEASIIKAVASLEKRQVNFLTERKGSPRNQYLTMWHCLISETTPAKVRTDIIPFLLEIKEKNIELLLKLNVLLQESGMDENQLVDLIKFIIKLPQEDHFVKPEYYGRVFSKHPGLPAEIKMKFLQQLSSVDPEKLGKLLEAAEAGVFDGIVIIDKKEFVLIPPKKERLVE